MKAKCILIPNTTQNFVLMQKGKLDELNFILTGGGMGGLPSYATDFYQDEPLVEFIEVDAEDADAEEKEDNQGSDTQRLLGLPQPVTHHMNIGCSNAIRYRKGSHVTALFAFFYLLIFWQTYKYSFSFYKLLLCCCTSTCSLSQLP